MEGRRLTCAESSPFDGAYHYHFANLHSAHWVRNADRNPLLILVVPRVQAPLHHLLMALH